MTEPGPWVYTAVGGARIQIGHYVSRGYLEVDKTTIHSFTITVGAKYVTGTLTNVPPYQTFSLMKNNILHQSKNYNNHFENSNF